MNKRCPLKNHYKESCPVRIGSNGPYNGMQKFYKYKSHISIMVFICNNLKLTMPNHNNCYKCIRHFPSPLSSSLKCGIAYRNIVGDTCLHIGRSKSTDLQTHPHTFYKAMYHLKLNQKSTSIMKST